MHPEWNATVVVKSLTINDGGQIVYTGKARNVTFDTVKFVGPFGPGLEGSPGGRQSRA